MSDENQKKDNDYEKAPQVTARVEPLFRAVMAVQSGELTVTQAARQLGLSRNRFQTRMHRALREMLSALEDRPQGRPPKPPREAELERELEIVKKENEQLKSRVETVDKLLGLASELAQGRRQLRGRSRQTGASPEPLDDGNSSDEPDGRARRALEKVQQMRALGVELQFAAVLASVSVSTLMRHARRAALGLPLVAHRGPPRESPTTQQLAAGESAVREMNGLIGAEALSHRVPGLSRRKAAMVKRATLTKMERERIAACERVNILTPGVMRGFDAMHVSTTAGPRFLLAAADASVPYRTLLAAVDSYDSSSVAAALERDIGLNGAPLVYRMDRASCHRTDEVRAVLNKHGVLLLHGPPRHPQYYAQLERQNREHRAWLNMCGPLEPQQLAEEAERMRYAWNSSLPRKSLSWRTASEVWSQRVVVEVARESFREEVQDRAARLQRQLDVRGGHADLAERLAIEATLTKYGWLVRQGGASC